MNLSFIAIVEVWLSGIIASIYLLLIAIRISLKVENFTNLSINSLEIPLFAMLLFCSIAYALGTAVNHIAESIFDPIFQHRFRKKLEEREGVSFFKTRAYVFQHGSESTLNDIKNDRQTIKIARANCFNFFVLGVSVMLYLNTDIITVSLILTIFLFCLLISATSFIQWMSRYKATYEKIYQIHNVLKNKNEKKQRN